MLPTRLYFCFNRGSAHSWGLQVSPHLGGKRGGALVIDFGHVRRRRPIWHGHQDVPEEAQKGLWFTLQGSAAVDLIPPKSSCGLKGRSFLLTSLKTRGILGPSGLRPAYYIDFQGRMALAG